MRLFLYCKMDAIHVNTRLTFGTTYSSKSLVIKSDSIPQAGRMSSGFFLVSGRKTLDARKRGTSLDLAVCLPGFFLVSGHKPWALANVELQ
jgi:hypothetical protein